MLLITLENLNGEIFQISEGMTGKKVFRSQKLLKNTTSWTQGGMRDFRNTNDSQILEIAC